MFYESDLDTRAPIRPLTIPQQTQPITVRSMSYSETRPPNAALRPMHTDTPPLPFAYDDIEDDAA